MGSGPSPVGQNNKTIRAWLNIQASHGFVSCQELRGYMTRQILMNIETGRGTVKHTYLEAFLDAYKVEANRLFPPERRRNRPRMLGLSKDVPTRKRAGRRKPPVPTDGLEDLAAPG